MLHYFKKIGKPVYAPNARAMGFAKYQISQGDLILYNETYDNEGNTRQRIGRVMGLVTHDGLGREYREPSRGTRTRAAPHLLVLACGDAMNHAYERHVDVKDVVEVRDPPNPAFIAWFFGAALPHAETIVRAVKYGAMNDRYFAEKGIVGDGWAPPPFT